MDEKRDAHKFLTQCPEETEQLEDLAIEERKY
jgi:hypothetical protein